MLRSAMVNSTYAGESDQVFGLRVELNWSISQPIGQDYTVFVHLENGGQLVAQHDGPPGDGSLPTSWWRPGDVIMDARLMPLQGADPSGRVSVGLYDPATLQRLAVLDAAGRPVRDSVEIK
jgi:hypothetical protein